MVQYVLHMIDHTCKGIYDMNNYPPSTHLTKKNSTIIKLNLQKYNSKIKIDSG